MSRPRTVKVGPFTWRIENVAPRDPGTIGETSLRDLAIRVDPTLPEDVWRETLLHELLHACHIVAGIDADNPIAPEAVVTATSPALLDLLRSNKAVRDYLMGAP